MPRLRCGEGTAQARRKERGSRGEGIEGVGHRVVGIAKLNGRQRVGRTPGQMNFRGTIDQEEEIKLGQKEDMPPRFATKERTKNEWWRRTNSHANRKVP